MTSTTHPSQLSWMGSCASSCMVVPSKQMAVMEWRLPWLTCRRVEGAGMDMDAPSFWISYW